MVSNEGKKESYGTSSRTQYAIRSVERVCDILDLLLKSPRTVSLSQIAEVTDVPKSSAWRYLAVLESRRYVERDADTGDYRLGMAFVPVSSSLTLLTEIAKPHLERLRDRFGETINLGVLDGRRVIYADILESPKAMRLSARQGDRDYVHSTALGKCIAAHLPEEQVLDILEAEGMPQLTTFTITEPGKYLKELESVRAKSYALDDQENEPDGRCVAVPIFGDHPLAALSLSAPEARFPKDHVERVAAELADTAKHIVDDLAVDRCVTDTTKTAPS